MAGVSACAADLATGMTHNAARLESIRDDFDAIARLSDTHAHASDRYDAFLAAQVPAQARRVLEVGCGLGRLAVRLAGAGREVTGVDLSPEMIARATVAGQGQPGLSFRCGDFFALDLPAAGFDCVLSVATLHHMDAKAAIARMVDLLAPGGRLVLHDLRLDDGIGDRARAACALAHHALLRLFRTGRLRSPHPVREAWARHGAHERYLTFPEARAMASRLLPGATTRYHWLWRYTIVWDKADVGRSRRGGIS